MSDGDEMSTPLHADDDTICESPEACSYLRLIYWRKTSGITVEEHVFE